MIQIVRQSVFKSELEVLEAKTAETVFLTPMMFKSVPKLCKNQRWQHKPHQPCWTDWKLSTRSQIGLTCTYVRRLIHYPAFGTQLLHQISTSSFTKINTNYMCSVLWKSPLTGFWVWISLLKEEVSTNSIFSWAKMQNLSSEKIHNNKSPARVWVQNSC